MIVSFDLHAACTYNFTRFLITFFLLIAIHDDPVKKLHQAGKELQHGGHIPLHLLPFSWPNPWNLLISLCLPVTIQVKGEVHNFSTTSNTNSRKAFQTCRSLEWPGIFIMFVLFHSNSFYVHLWTGMTLIPSSLLLCWFIPCTLWVGKVAPNLLLQTLVHFYYRHEWQGCAARCVWSILLLFSIWLNAQFSPSNPWNGKGEKNIGVQTRPNVQTKK